MKCNFHMCQPCTLWLRSVLCLSALAFIPWSAAETFHIASFQVEVTPPIGHALMGGGIVPAKEIIDPLYAKGIVLLGQEAPLVWVAVDWCEIRNDAYTAWRDALADAADTTAERVLLASVHQHDTPVADFTAQALLDEVGLEKSLCDVAFVRDCIARTAGALRAALPQAVVVSHYGIGQAEVENVASNRRVVAADGTVGFPRNSSAPDPALQNAPVGQIDPILRILSFWNGDQALTALSTYAVHPMSFYGKGGVSADFVGMARERMQADIPGVACLYFSGCSGDVVAGKYNDGSEAERPKLAERMYKAMREAWAATEKHPMQKCVFRNSKMVLPMRETEDFSAKAQRVVLNDALATTFNRNLAAMGLSSRKANETGFEIGVGAVDFGKAQFLLMPAESFVAYQLEAQHLRTESTVLVAGYGECAPGYIPSASAIGENFIEQHNWCWVGQKSPVAMTEAMMRALAAL